MNKLLYGVPHPSELDEVEDEYYNEDRDVERYYESKYER